MVYYKYGQEVILTIRSVNLFNIPWQTRGPAIGIMTGFAQQ